MSHSGSGQALGPRLSALRGGLAALSMACAALTGCERRPAVSDTPAKAVPDAVSRTVLAGYDAFRRGDQVALLENLQKLSAHLPSDETQGVFVDCSPERARLRRLEQARRILTYLDNGTVLAMAEEDRFIYFQQLNESGLGPIDDKGRLTALGGSDPRDPLFNPNLPSDFECGLTKGYSHVEVINERQGEVLQSAGRQRLGEWLISLRAQFGPQLDVRMQNAAHQLNGYQLVMDDDWHAPTLQLNDVVADEPVQPQSSRDSGLL